MTVSHGRETCPPITVGCLYRPAGHFDAVYADEASKNWQEALDLFFGRTSAPRGKT